MKKKLQLALILLAVCLSARAASGYDFVRVSRKDGRYFETSDSRTWIPVMMNYLVPDRDTSLSITEDYFRRFSENGGNAIRVWISCSSLEVEKGAEGDYSSSAMNRIERLVSLAGKYGIRVKFTLTHIRSISSPESRANAWANRKNLSAYYSSIVEYTGTDRGRESYLDRAAFLSKNLSWSPEIWGWELWNEMNAAAWENEAWADFTEELLPRVHRLFPRHTVTQTLGSLDRTSADRSYALLAAMDGIDYIPVHRYLDEGEQNYDEVKGPVDLLVKTAMERFTGKGKPVLMNEIGAVRPSHAGPSALYGRDSLGVLMHDMLFAPFFCGAAGCGAMWHWDAYVSRNNLWWQYSRFCKAVEGIDPAEEEFSPSFTEASDVRFYSLEGRRTSLIWCRDARSDWRTELRDGNPAPLRKGVKLAIKGRPSMALIYDPWENTTTALFNPCGKVSLPPFRRSVVVRLVYGPEQPGDGILIEAESFRHKGGWKTDQQFMDQMGSAYLLAHGAGVPVRPAQTEFVVKDPGLYKVYARTYNWTSPWDNSKPGPGRWKLSVGELNAELGFSGNRWEWQEAGTVRLDRGVNQIVLTDLTGFDGRVDAVWLSAKGTVPPDSEPGLEEFRRRHGGIVRVPDKDAGFDFVVAGAGIAGMCAAMAAARQGLKVALVGDRPLPGGNNSSEVRVHLGGRIENGKYRSLGRMLREFGHSGMGNAKPAGNYEDWKKTAFISGEDNITFYSSTRVTGVSMDGNTIKAVVCRDIESGAEFLLEAPVFCDCTGDANLGALAGADYRMGREASSEYGESLAPAEADSLTMGASVQWYSVEGDTAIPFPEFSYGLEFNDGNCEKVTHGEWTWETGMDRDQISEAERIRDYGLLVVYSNWSWLKNHSSLSPGYGNRSLEWVAFIAGKRESRRLMGDYVVTQNDFYSYVAQPDASFANSWSIDLHFPDPDNSVKFPGEEFKASTKHIGVPSRAVPYRSLYSRNIDNLLMAGRNISATHVALGTLRVMRTTAMMGEVAGMAASVAFRHNTTPRGVYERHLGELVGLMQEGASLKEDLPDNQHFN